MQIYWRVQQDLNCLGEVILFHDPSLLRSLRQWIRRNYIGLTLAEEISYTNWSTANRN